MGCFCKGITVNKKKKQVCICTPNIGYLCDDGPAPCSGLYSVDLEDHINTELCGGDYEITVVEKSPEIVNVTIDGDVIDMEVEGDPLDELYIHYKVSCMNSKYSSVGKISICVKSLCKGFVPSEEGECCDPCTGLGTLDCPETNGDNFDIIVK